MFATISFIWMALRKLTMGLAIKPNEFEQFNNCIESKWCQTKRLANAPVASYSAIGARIKIPILSVTDRV